MRLLLWQFSGIMSRWGKLSQRVQGISFSKGSPTPNVLRTISEIRNWNIHFKRTSGDQRSPVVKGDYHFLCVIMLLIWCGDVNYSTPASSLSGDMLLETCGYGTCFFYLEDFIAFCQSQIAVCQFHIYFCQSQFAIYQCQIAIRHSQTDLKGNFSCLWGWHFFNEGNRMYAPDWM